MPRVSAVLLPDHLEQPVQSGRVAVVIDVLRATTTIAQAFISGAKSITPAASLDAARMIAHGKPGALLCGERGGMKPEGFILGNSPYEYSTEQVGDQELILTTTNGTRALQMCSDALEVYTGSITNLDLLSEVLQADSRDVVLVCSGTDLKPAMEDAFCAGLIIDRLLDSHDLDDSALLLHHAAAGAISVFGSIEDVVKSSFHARRLIDLGFAKDVALSSELGSARCLPVFDPATGEIRPAILQARVDG
jgi:2-phosphosulfolactate phosphatase